MILSTRGSRWLVAPYIVLLLVAVSGPSSQAQSRKFFRSESVLQDRIEKLEEYSRELERLLVQLRRGQIVGFKEIQELEKRYEISLLDAVDMELADVYRLEALVKTLSARPPRMSTISTAEMTVSRDEMNPVAGTEEPRPEPPRDPALDLTPGMQPVIKTDWAKMGDSYFSLGKYQNSLQAYLKTREEDRTPRILYQIALCYERLAQYPSAKRVYEEVVRDHGDTYWGKQSVWALDYVSWKQELDGIDPEEPGAQNEEDDQ